MISIARQASHSTITFALALFCAAEVRAQQPPPPNDNLANAVEVSGVEFQLAANLGAATREAFEPYTQYNFGRTAWWRWTAPADGIYEWNSQVSSNAVAVAVYRLDSFSQLNLEASTYRQPVESVSGLTLVPQQMGSFQAKQGAHYAIQLDVTWTYSLVPIVEPPSWTVGSRPVLVDFRKFNLVAPANDNFANRSTLFGSNIFFTLDLAAATGEPNEPR